MNKEESILSIIDNKIDSMLGKKKKEEPHEEKPNIVYATAKNMSDLSSQIKEFNETIKNITPIIIPFTFTTKVINTWNLKATNKHTILKKNGTGIVKEVRIVTKHEFELYLKTDSTELFNIHSSFKELSELSQLSENILTKEDNSIKTLVIKNISFNKDIEISISFNGNIDIQNIFCIYDIRTT